MLVEALAPLADLPWRLTIVGDRERDPAARRASTRDRPAMASPDAIELPGRSRPTGSRRSMPRADLFVLASRFEGYGMAFAEAIAHGLPVIGTTGGAIPETVPARPAGWCRRAMSRRSPRRCAS